MIISASRRTDIPAFYAEWMVRRLREGYCTVPNPFNRNQVSRISLTAGGRGRDRLLDPQPPPPDAVSRRTGLPRIPLLLPVHDPGISAGDRPQVAIRRNRRRDVLVSLRNDLVRAA